MYNMEPVLLPPLSIVAATFKPLVSLTTTFVSAAVISTITSLNFHAYSLHFRTVLDQRTVLVLFAF